MVPPTQCGATRGKGTDLANHLLRSVQDYARMHNKSLAILFVDLSKAFDKIIREIVMGWFDHEWPEMTEKERRARCVNTLKGHGLSGRQAKRLTSTIEASFALGEAGVDAHTIALLKSMHSESWFKIRGADEHLVFKLGGRQGCKFGSVVFNMAYARALAQFVREAEREGIAVRLRFKPKGAVGPQPTDGGSDSDSTSLLFDVTFVDDEAICVLAKVPEALVSKFQRCVVLLRKAFDAYGLNINWKRTKTEAILELRGPKAQKIKAAIAAPSGEKGIVNGGYRCRHPTKSAVCTPEAPVHVCIVREYKHLGAIVEQGGGLVKEARNRESAALGAFAPLASRLFGAKAIGRTRRVNLAKSLVISRLLYNVHVWSEVKGEARNILNGTFMRTWRRVAGDPKIKERQYSDFEVREMLGIPSLDNMIRKRRLQYLGRLARSKLDALVAILQTVSTQGEMPWVTTIRGDLALLKRHLPRELGSMSDPYNDLLPWWILARDHPREWKQLLNRFHTCRDDVELLEQQRAVVETQDNPSGGVVSNDPVDAQLGHVCSVCKKAFPTYKQMSAHARSAHGRMSDFRVKIGNISRCPVCETEFYTRSRLLRHLSERRVRSKARGEPCQTALLRLQLPDVPNEEFQKLEAEDASTRRSYRRGGHRTILSEIPATATKPRPYAAKVSAEVPPPPAILAARPPSNRRRLQGKQPPPPQYRHMS